MRRAHIPYLLLVGLLLALGMGGCTKGSKSVEAPAPGAKSQASQPKPVDRTGWPVIVALGDSLTYGERVDPTRNYPTQLQAELDRLGYQYRVVNAGISGDTSAGGLNRVQAVLNQKPAVVILELGANDGLQGQSLDQMTANLSKIIERLQNAGVTVVLAGMQIPPNYGPEYTQSFANAYQRLADQYKLPLIPFLLDGVGGRPELNLPDGIHPTAEGYTYVVQNVIKVLEPLLKK